MSGRDASASAPPSWMATQQWLDDLDKDAPPRSDPPDDHDWPTEPDYDGAPTDDLDVIDADDDTTPDAEVDDADEQPTVPLGDASEQATVRLANAFGRDYTPARRRRRPARS